MIRLVKDWRNRDSLPYKTSVGEIHCIREGNQAVVYIDSKESNKIKYLKVRLNYVEEAKLVEKPKPKSKSVSSVISQKKESAKAAEKKSSSKKSSSKKLSK